MCSTDVYCSKQPAAVAPKETITHHFFVSELKKKTVDAAKICGGAEMLLKQKPSKTSVNGLLGFITLGIYTRWKACIVNNNSMSCPLISGKFPHSHCSLIYFVPSSCFCIVISLSLEGEIIPFSGRFASGRLHYPRRRRWWLHALTDRLL